MRRAPSLLLLPRRSRFKSAEPLFVERSDHFNNTASPAPSASYRLAILLSLETHYRMLGVWERMQEIAGRLEQAATGDRP